jgi:hypothetical protein
MHSAKLAGSKFVAVQILNRALVVFYVPDTSNGFVCMGKPS